MRKNKSGRPTKIENVKEKVKRLRELDYSYTEIGNTLGISRQLAWYHSKYPVDKNTIVKELPSDII